MGRLDFKRIELVQNGRVVGTAASRPEGDHFVATLELSRAIDAAAWLALRTPPPPVKDDPELQEPVAENEFGGRLFSHTSPIYVHFKGQGVFDAQTAAGLVTEMKSAIEKIEAQAVFDNSAQRQQVLQVYQDAIKLLEGRLNR